MINTIDNLWIRAAKSEDPKKRLESVYNRLFLKPTDNKDADFHIAKILSSLCDKYFPMSVSSLVYVLSPRTEDIKGFRPCKGIWGLWQSDDSAFE